MGEDENYQKNLLFRIGASYCGKRERFFSLAFLSGRRKERQRKSYRSTRPYFLCLKLSPTATKFQSNIITLQALKAQAAAAAATQYPQSVEKRRTSLSRRVYSVHADYNLSISAFRTLAYRLRNVDLQQSILLYYMACVLFLREKANKHKKKIAVAVVRSGQDRLTFSF